MDEHYVTDAIKHSYKHLSVNHPINKGTSKSLLDIIADHNSQESDEATISKDLSDNAKHIIEQTLNERECRILKMIYGIDCLPMTMAEIAIELGIKRERVRQIRDKATRKVQKIKKKDS